MNKNLFVFAFILVATFFAQAARAADCEENRAFPDLYRACLLAAELEAQGQRSDQIVEYLGELTDSVLEVKGQVATLASAPAPQAPAVQTAPTQAAPTFVEVGMPGRNAAARSCSMLPGIIGMIDIRELEGGFDQHVTRNATIYGKVIVLKHGEPLEVVQSRPAQPFYADLDQDGSADPIAYNGLPASGDVCVQADPNEVVQVVYLIPGGSIEFSDGQRITKWVIAARVNFRAGATAGLYRKYAFSGMKML